MDFEKSGYWCLSSAIDADAVLVPGCKAEMVCLGRGELGDSLGPLRNSMLRELTGEHKTDSRLDFSARPEKD